MRTICVFTGTRAEFGLLRPLIGALQARQGVSLKLLVSGAHLADSAGATWREIADAGLAIDERVEVLMDSNTETSVCTAMGLGMMRYGEALKRLGTDCLVLLGDRFEAFAAAAAATACRIPIGHIHGGELTLGAMDEAFRHAITKMSHLHFTSTEEYRQRVIQLGEQPARVFNVGALGVQNARRIGLLERSEVERRLGLAPGQRFLLVTFHPATLDLAPPAEQLQALLDALAEFPDLAVVFTGANADLGGSAINQKLSEHVRQFPDRYRFSMSLGATLYLSAVACAEAVVGNSSSGVIEVPSFGIPSVDIGRRQQGRIRAASVLSCAPAKEAIAGALRRALAPEFRRQVAQTLNPYEKPGTAEAIADVLATWPLEGLLHKEFHDFTPAGTERP